MAAGRGFAFLLTLFLHFVSSLSQSEAELLLKFKESLKNTDALSNWDKAKPPCDGDNAHWHGVLCGKGAVYGLQLENTGLSGEIDLYILANLKGLRTISFMNNSFEGPLPNFIPVGALKMIYLSNNGFSGEIQGGSFAAMLSLKKLHLANNRLSGEIPGSLTLLPKLMELMLENNSFEGGIPNFGQESLSAFDVSDNELGGEIPPGLSRFDAAAFDGNKGLCGSPLEPCPKSRSLSKGAMILIVSLIATAFLAVMLAVVILACRKRKHQQNRDNDDFQNKPGGHEDLDTMEQGRGGGAAAAAASTSSGSLPPGPNGKLTFVRDGVENLFEMADLLQASADVLGNGVFGSTYKADLPGGNAVVVKRCRHMSRAGREEFGEHMRRLGRLRHENVLPLVAFYYRKEEKLLVADYAENLSLHVHLHDPKSRGLPRLDWPTRLNIVKGIARGLSYLHDQLPTLTAPHGHLKSSNVLLDRSLNPLLADYGLIPLVDPEHARAHMVSYMSPEFALGGSLTKKTDVWSLGILMLEVLTVKDASCFVGVDKVEEDALYPEMGEAAVRGRSEVEMKKLMRIGSMCCSAERPEMKEVLGMIEEVRDRTGDADDEFYSVRSSRSAEMPEM